MYELVSSPVQVVLKEDQIYAIGPTAIKIYNLGQYGTPIKGGKLLLTPFEALHLIEREKILFKDAENSLIPIPIATAIFTKLEDEFITRYLVYKDLRNRGYPVATSKGNNFFFRLYERGTKMRESPALYYIIPLKEGQSIPIKVLESLILESQRNKKQLVVGLVDSLGDVSYLIAKNHYFTKNQKGKHSIDINWEKEWNSTGL